MKLFSKDLLDIVLKIGGYTGKIERYYRIIKVTVFDIECHLPLIIFLDFYLMIDTSQVQLCELFGLV